jgi:hypothetical protein
MAVYDFVPDALLKRVANLPEFLGVLVFDKWTGNADSRQSVFFRARLREGPRVEEAGMRLGFWTLMLDNGYIFNGPHWEYVDSALSGLYYRPLVYDSVRSIDDFEPWLERVTHFPEEILDEAVRQVPPEWVAGATGDLERMLEKLLRRRRRVPDLIRDCKSGRINPFPNWS